MQIAELSFPFKVKYLFNKLLYSMRQFKMWDYGSSNTKAFLGVSFYLFRNILRNNGALVLFPQMQKLEFINKFWSLNFKQA